MVGAYQHPNNCEMLYLVDWINYDGPKKVEWLPAHDLDSFASLDSNLEDERVLVWWGLRRGAKPSTLNTASVWSGVIQEGFGGEGDESTDEDDDGDKGTSKAQLRKARHAFTIKYDDGDVDVLELQTLQFVTVVCTDARKRVERVAWMLESYSSAERIDMAMELCDPAHMTPAGTGRQDNNVESSSDDDVPLNVRCEPHKAQLRRSARNVPHPKGYNPAVDGCSDKNRKSGNNARNARKKKR